MPMGEESIRFVRATPGASRALTWLGRRSPPPAARSAGTSDSRISVVLPEPDTPVIADKRPRGRSSDRACTVCRGAVSRWMRPSVKTLSGVTGVRTSTRRAPDRKPPMREAGSSDTFSTVPVDTTVPPPEPEPGPISMSQSAWRNTRTSWSTTTTELPSSSRLPITDSRPSTLEGCKPIDGSSST